MDLELAHKVALRRAGAIVSLMGDSGRVGESRLLVTATARAATVGLTRSPARDFARMGVGANCVSIALVQTDRFDVHAGGAGDERMQRIIAQYPLGRVGRTDDVTPMVLLLASPRAAWITGQVVSVNGCYAML
jgi:NAD(P)-dependent dehydrogenase (short-subunit alcohol dehydrogenase family)